MDSYPQYLEELRRWHILSVLAADADYEANDQMLEKACEALRLPSTRDQVRTSLAWLERNGMVVTENIGGGYLSAKLTKAGRDVGTRKVTSPGIARPEPEL